MRNPSSSPIVPPKIAVIFGILAVSAASIFVRFAQQEASSIVIAAYRLGIAVLLLIPITSLRYRRNMQNLSTGDLSLGLLSGVFLAIHFATWITSLEFTTVASSVVIVTTTPLWVSLLSPLVLQEAIARRVKIGLVVALGGTVIIGLIDICEAQGGFSCPSPALFFSGRAVWGDFLALIGAWGAAGYVMIGRKIRAKLPLIPYVTLVYGVAALILIAVMLGGSEPVYGFSSSTYLWLVLLALVPQLLGHSTFNWALGYLSAAFVSISLLGEPIGSTILAYILLQEIPSPLKIFGAVLILGGILIASQDNSTANPEA
jgi:drug/metabolite transporter (DMT)-like permease